MLHIMEFGIKIQYSNCLVQATEKIKQDEYSRTLHYSCYSGSRSFVSGTLGSVIQKERLEDIVLIRNTIPSDPS